MEIVHDRAKTLQRVALPCRIFRTLLLLIALACSAEPAAPVRTDRASYALGDEVAIVSTLTAPRDRAVHVDNCNGAISTGLQRLVDGKWIDAWVTAMDACASAPIVIPAGGTHTATLLVRPGAGAVLHPRGNTDAMLEAGTYRVVWFGVDLPLEQRVSSPIRIGG